MQTNATAIRTVEITSAGIALQVAAGFAVGCDLLIGSTLAQELLLIAVPLAATSPADGSVEEGNSLFALRECVGSVRRGDDGADDEVDTYAANMLGVRKLLLPVRLGSGGSSLAGPALDMLGSVIVALSVAAAHAVISFVVGKLLVVKRAPIDPTLKRSSDLLAPSPLFLASQTLMFPTLSYRIASWLLPGIASVAAALLLTMRKGGNGAHLFLGFFGALLCLIIVGSALYTLRVWLPRSAAYHGYNAMDVAPQSVEDVLLASQRANDVAPVRHTDPDAADDVNARLHIPTDPDDVVMDFSVCCTRVETALQPHGYWKRTRHAKGHSLHLAALYEDHHGLTSASAATSISRVAFGFTVFHALRVAVLSFLFGAPFIPCTSRFVGATVVHIISAVVHAVVRPHRYTTSTVVAFMVNICCAFACLAAAAEGITLDATVAVAATVTLTGVVLRLLQWVLEHTRWREHERELARGKARVVMRRNLAAIRNFEWGWARQRRDDESAEDDDGGDRGPREMRAARRSTLRDSTSQPPVHGIHQFVPLPAEDSSEGSDSPPPPPPITEDSPVHGLWNPLASQSLSRVGRQPPGALRSRLHDDGGDARRDDVPEPAPPSYPPPRRRFVCYDGADHIYVDEGAADDDAVARLGLFSSGDVPNPTAYTRNAPLFNALVAEGGWEPPKHAEMRTSFLRDL
jgi:hypothetical protein